MLENKNKGVGHQLTSDELHEQQKRKNVRVPAPIVIAVGIADPANIGTLFRICDSVGTKKIIFVETPNIKPEKVKRISRHTSEKIKHCFLSIEEFLNMASDLPPLVALEITSKSTNIYATELMTQMTFIIGNERHGIPQKILDVCDTAVHIPMFGINSSMNVATSLGIALYEWRRRFQ